MSNTDLELLAHYVRDRSEDAFAELVRRHIDLVYSAALRQVRSPQLAEEVAQSVFTDLAQSATRLASDTILTAWLYQVTRCAAIDVVRREARRQLREQIATEMNAVSTLNTDWTHIAPLLDEAMEALDETGRAAVLLRFFENKSLRQVGESLGTSDDTAQKRVSRAVERLREFFARRGITVGTGGLTAVISAHAVQAAPAGLTTTISTAAGAAGAIGALGFATHTAMNWIQAKSLVTVAVATLIVGTTSYLLHQREANKLRYENRRLVASGQQMAGELEAIHRANDLLQQENKRLNVMTAELAKLRGEVARLRAAAARASANRNVTEPQAASPSNDQGITNALPYVSFSGTNRVTVGWDHTVVTGGWKTPSGKRVFVFTTPTRGDDSNQLTVQSRFAEFPEDVVGMLGLSQLTAGNRDSADAPILTRDEFGALVDSAEKKDGVDFLNAPSVSTLSGRQAQIQIVDFKSVPTGEKYALGPVVDFLPTISSDGMSVDLMIIANLNYALPGPGSTGSVTNSE